MKLLNLPKLMFGENLDFLPTVSVCRLVGLEGLRSMPRLRILPQLFTCLCLVLAPSSLPGMLRLERS